MSEKLIEIKELSAGYNGNIAIFNVNLDIFSEDFIGVIGPNGGGKTTLVKSILGLLRPMSGEVKIFQKESNSSLIGYLPQINQFDQKFPITVIDVVLSGLSKKENMIHHFSKGEKSSALQLLEDFGMLRYKDKAIGALSGGEKQRAFLCRAIISEPQLLILDEPSTFADNQFEYDLYSKLHELNQKMAIIIVSHDIGTISSYIKTIACVNRELHYHPSNIITEKQLQSYNCPLQIITHGDIPHTVLEHHHKH